MCLVMELHTPNEIISNRVFGLWLGIGEGADIIVSTIYKLFMDGSLGPYAFISWWQWGIRILDFNTNPARGLL